MNLSKIDNLDLRNTCVVCNDDTCICKKCENIKTIRSCPNGSEKDCNSEECTNFKDWLSNMKPKAEKIKKKEDYLTKFF